MTAPSVGLDADLDEAAVGRVLDRVLDEVDEHLAHAVAVGRDGRALVFGHSSRAGCRAARARARHSTTRWTRSPGVEGLLDEVEAAGVELVGEEDLVDDAVQALGLVDDQRDEAVAPRLVEREVVAAECLRGAVDGGERRAELVGGGGDEFGLQLLEAPRVGDVAERVDDAAEEVDAGDGDPALAARGLEREGLRLDRARWPSPTGMRSARPFQPAIASPAGRPSTASRREAGDRLGGRVPEADRARRGR